MKAFLLLLGAVAAGLLLAACESDIADGTEVPQKFQRGIRGNGTIYEPDRSGDPMIHEESRVGD